MQPHPPQLPTDGIAASSPRRWHKPVLWFILAAVVLAVVVTVLLPQKSVEGRNAPTPTQHRAQSPAYSHPAH